MKDSRTIYCVKHDFLMLFGPAATNKINKTQIKKKSLNYAGSKVATI